MMKMCIRDSTCTVTATGDKKSRQALRAAKRQNPNAVVVAVGCYAQMDPDALLSMPEVDFVLGNLHKPELPALLRRHLEGAPLPPVDDIGLVHDFEPMSAVRSDRTRAIIKIQDGCNNFCSYCVIPYARGRIPVSYTHLDVYKRQIYTSVEDYLNDFKKVYDKVYEITGVKPEIFRFPGGSVNGYNGDIYQELIAEMMRRGFSYYDWNVSSADATGSISADTITKNCLSGIHAYRRSIVLMHDSAAKKTTAQALPGLLDTLIAEGYELSLIHI